MWSRFLAAGELGVWGEEWAITKEHVESCKDEGYAYCLYYGDGFKTPQIVYFNCGQFIVCQLYLSKSEKKKMMFNSEMESI